MDRFLMDNVLINFHSALAHFNNTHSSLTTFPSPNNMVYQMRTLDAQ